MITVELDKGRCTTALRYEPSAPPARARIVLAHGAGAGQSHPFIVNVARRLAAAGLEVVTFNFLHMEQRRRVPDRTDVLEHCFRRVLDAVHDTGDSRAVFIGGKSMGGRIATHLAAAGAPIAGVFALGYPLHPPGKPGQLRAAHLPAITAPVLIVQGERDPFGTPPELAPVIQTMQARVQLEVVAGGDHSLAVRGVSRDDGYHALGALVERWIRHVCDSAQSGSQPHTAPRSDR